MKPPLRKDLIMKQALLALTAVLALAATASADSGMAAFAGSYTLVPDSNGSCNNAIVLSSVEDQTLSTNLSVAPFNLLKVGTTRTLQADRWIEDVVSFSGTSIEQKNSWGQHCLVNYLKVSCFYSGETDTTWSLDDVGDLKQSVTQTASGAPGATTYQCIYKRN